jgi:exodeoxyribonuclease V alpha subunit
MATRPDAADEVHPPTAAAIAGVVERVLLHRPETGYSVLRLLTLEQAPVTVVGLMPQAEPGEFMRAEGSWYEDRVWGRQFRAESVRLDAPTSEEGLVAYLVSLQIKGVAEVGARRLVKRFGVELGEIIEKTPERLREVPGVGHKLVERIQAAWGEKQQGRELLLFLNTHGIRGGHAARILKTYGTRTREVVVGDPYLLAREVRGIGFRTADAIALKVGVPADSPQRLAAAVCEVLRLGALDGHTALPADALGHGVREMVSADESAIEAAVARELQAGRIVATSTYLALRELDAAERTIARRLRELARQGSPWPDLPLDAALARAEEALGIELAPAQREAIALALRRRLLVITGGPGTGKTTLVRGILAAIEGAGPRVLLAAPTGRAARRLADSTRHEASTLHRLLEADPERGFRRHAGRQLDCDLLVVDETSMVDTQLMAGLLEALPPDAALLLVGDADQLPSIGPGQVLADLIASGTVPVLRLSEVFRQAAGSGIVRSAHRINQGQAPDFAHGEIGPGDLYGIRVESPADATAKLVDLVTERIPQRFGLDPMTGIQILTPVHRGPLGTKALNALLAARLNPSPTAMLTRGDTRLALGDKVMQLENDHEREVYNGDVGQIVGVDREVGALEVMMEGRRLHYTAEQVERLAPAFAVTVHKSQGSEYPAVVLPLLRQHGRMLRRNLLYTAVTRARRLCVLLTEPRALERAIMEAGDTQRITLLGQRLTGLEQE